MQHGSSVGLFAYTFLHVWRQFVKEEEEKAMVEKEQESGDREKKNQNSIIGLHLSMLSKQEHSGMEKEAH